MNKNKVEQEYTEILKKLAEGYFDKEVEHAHELFGEAAWPDQDDPHYIKKTTFVINARVAHLRLLKTLAQHISGAVHPQGENSMLEKQQADNLMQQAKTRIANKIKKDEESKVINIDPKAKNE
jgi:hypothetical protein